MIRGAILGLSGALFAGCGLFPSLDGLTGGSDATPAVDAGDATVADASDASDAGEGGSSSDALPEVSSDAPGTGPAFVHGHQDSTPTTATSFAVPITSTTAGNLLVVAVTQESGVSAIITGITDDAQGGTNAYASANQRSIDSDCSNTAEIWYAANIHAGAQNVTVTMSTAVGFEVWVAEFSGVTALDVGATANTQPSGATIGAPTVVPSVPRSVIVSVATTCGAVSAIHAGSPFTALPILDGEDAAYYIASSASSYGAVWDYSGGTWNGSTAAFR